MYIRFCNYYDTRKHQFITTRVTHFISFEKIKKNKIFIRKGSSYDYENFFKYKGYTHKQKQHTK